MAASITFDFLSRGAPGLARDLKGIGDNGAAAARGAKVLSTAIETLGTKENRTAAESKILATALRGTGDAEDRVAAKAVLADAAVRRLDDAMSDASKSAKGARGGIAGLVGEITGFGAASDAASSGGNKFKLALAGLNLATGVLEPALAGAVVAAGGLGAAFAAAGAGAGAYMAALKPLLSQTAEVTKAQETLDKARATAQANYDAALKSGMSVKDADAARTKAMTKAQETYNQAVQGTPAPVREFAKEVTTAKTTYEAWADSLARPVLGPLSIALKLVRPALTAITPLVRVAAGAFGMLVTELSAKVNAGGLTSIVNTILPHVRATMLDLGHAAGNVAAGVWGILKAFLPVSGQITGGVVKLTALFKEWAQSLPSHSGFQSLMAMFREQTPQALEVLRNLAATLLNVGKAMTGLSTFSNSKMLLSALMPLSAVLEQLSRNRALVNIVLYLYAAHAASSKLIPAFAGVKAGITGIGTALKFASANPLILVAAAIVAVGAAAYIAWKKSAGFRDAIKSLGTGILQVGIVIVQGAKIIVDTWMTVVGTIIHGAAMAFGWVPGLGGKLRSADAAFQNLRAGVDKSFNGMIDKLHQWQGSLNASKRTTDATSAAIVADLTKAGYSAAAAKNEVSAYTAAVQRNGAQSQAARGARANLIRDLTNSGVSARDANRLVNNLQASINAMRGKTVNVGVHATGSGSVHFASHQAGSVQIFTHPPSGGLNFFAAGGRVTGGVPGRDSVPIMATPGEVVIPTTMVRAGEVDHLRGKLPGFAAGGLVKPVTAPRDFMASAEQSAGRQAESGYASAVQSAMFRAFAAAVQAAANKAFTAMKVPNVGSGIARWAPLVRQALAMEHLNPSLVLQVLFQIQTESGGNPNAINLSDSNAARGDPSRGLLQTIGSTFRAYHWPGTSWNIYDPLANIAAGINYARHRYGPTLMSGGMGLGSGHGYAEGTGGASPGWAWVGEKGPELVRMRGGEQVLPAHLSGYAAGAAGLRGYAAGTAGAGAAYLAAWEHRRGTGAHGPTQLNPQIDTANRILSRDAALAQATLPAAQHRYYANAAAWWRSHRNALLHERSIMGAWRAQLGASDRTISTWIRAAGTSRSLAPSVRRWKYQQALQELEIGRISRMLGLTGAARAAAAKAAPPKPKPPPGPSAAQASKEGPAYLKAWQTRHGGGYGAAWGPTVVNEQIDQMTAAMKRAQTLAAARGLTAGQRKFWANAATDERKRLTVLTHERDIERAWRAALAADDAKLTSWITTAGTNPSLAKNAAAWKAQLARQKATIAGISGMLGYSAAYLKAHPTPPPQPTVTHTYGGDVANTIGTTLAAALGPFTGAPATFDRGGTLKPGLSTVLNATGRPEQLIPARGGSTLRVEWVGGNGGDDLERWIRKNIRIRGGGDVQRAWGSR